MHMYAIELRLVRRVVPFNQDKFYFEMIIEFVILNLCMLYTLL